MAGGLIVKTPATLLTQSMTAKKRAIVLTVDAFGTLFTRREPIAKQYGYVARKHGLSGFTDEEVETNFRIAFKKESSKHPNYGRAVGMEAPEWWTNVIQSTISPLIPASSSLPKKLVPDLLSRFSSADGYTLFPDVPPFFESIRKARERSCHNPVLPKVILGVITNSDDRVLPILTSLHTRITPRRYRPNAEAYFPTWQPGDDSDIEFVTLSYDVGFEKPDRRIFAAAKELVHVEEDAECEYIHVGDDLEKDARGAKAAGWIGVVLDRDNQYESQGLPRVRSLAELGDIVSKRITQGEKLSDYWH